MNLVSLVLLTFGLLALTGKGLTIAKGEPTVEETLALAETRKNRVETGVGPFTLYNLAAGMSDVLSATSLYLNVRIGFNSPSNKSY